MEVDLVPGNFVFDGDPAPPPQKRHGLHSTQFLAYVYCGQRGNGWMDQDVTLYGGEPRPGDVVLDRVAAPPKRGTAPVFSSCLLRPNGCMDEDATCYGNRPRPRPHCVRRGPSSPAKGAQQPPFSSHVNAQTAEWIKTPLGTEVGLILGDIVLDHRWGPSSPLPKGHKPPFSATVRCGQTAGWTKMPLAMEVGLGPGNFVFDGDPLPSFPRKQAQPLR